MLKKIIIALTTLLVAARGITIPKDLAPGAYFASIDVNGNEIHQKIHVDLNGTVAARGLSGRGSIPGGSQTVCVARTVSDDDMFGRGHCWDQFWNGCKSLGDQHLYNKRAFYIYYGDSVSYMCNYSSGGNPCNQDEWAEAVGSVRNQCQLQSSGRDQAGYVEIYAWNKAYGFDASDQSFC